MAVFDTIIKELEPNIQYVVERCFRSNLAKNSVWLRLASNPYHSLNAALAAGSLEDAEIFRVRIVEETKQRIVVKISK